MSGAESPPLVRVYDLRDPAAQQAAHRHRGFWGKLYTEIHALDYDHVALVFRPAPDERWRRWESVRLRWILEDRGAAA
jgi:hypothetical protein